MDFGKDFEENFLKQWAHKNKVPVPSKKHPGMWNQAWAAYIQEYLIPNKDEIIQDYLEMKFKTKVKPSLKPVPEDIEEHFDEDTEEFLEDSNNENLTDWEKVQMYLKEDKNKD